MPVTHVEVADHIADAFTGRPVTRDELVAAAAGAGARPAVLRVLERLPHGPVYEMRQARPALPDVPIEPEPAQPARGSLSS